MRISPHRQSLPASLTPGQWLTALAMAALATLPTSVWGQQPKPPAKDESTPAEARVEAGAEDEAEAVEAWMKFYAARAEQYEVSFIDSKGKGTDSEGKGPELHPQPLLRYTNPVRQREQHGAIFVWTLQGRPQLIASLWSINDAKNDQRRRTAHELHSLSERPLLATRPPMLDQRFNQQRQLADRLFPTAGLEFQTLASAPPVAESAPRRLAQMRRLFSQFSAVTFGRNDGKEIALRPMSSPLLRYQCQDQGVTDGGLFAFTLATDPELFLLIECATDAKGQLKWRAAPARFTGLALRLDRGAEEFWKCAQKVGPAAEAPYDLALSVSVLEKLPPEIDSSANEGAADVTSSP